jgi:SAM-dependent methyltransferase
LRTEPPRTESASPPPRDPTERFSDRVDDYVRYRPGYPRALIDHLRERGILHASSVVADIGAGTGISSALFLDAGCDVHAVEPNAAMRSAAERLLDGRSGFHSVDARAERTTLADASIDLVTVGTAFHWFEPVATRAEFARILRPHGHVALFWNLRRRDGAFMRKYEDILMTHCQDYAVADAARRADDATVNAFFDGGPVESTTFDNAQHLDFDGLLGRVLSSSYAPKPGDPAHAPMRAALRAVFDACAVEGKITLDYDTRLHVGRMN